MQPVEIVFRDEPFSRGVRNTLVYQEVIQFFLVCRNLGQSVQITTYAPTWKELCNSNLFAVWVGNGGFGKVQCFAQSNSLYQS